MFISLSHFELIFVYGVRVQFHSLACGYLVFLTLFVEETIFTPLYILGICVEDQLNVYEWTCFWLFDIVK